MPIKAISVLTCLLFLQNMVFSQATYNSLQEKIRARYGATFEVEDLYTNQIEAFQEELNADYADPDKSPLNAAQRATFTGIGGHDFFPIDPDYRVVADLEVYERPETVSFPTSSEVVKEYLVYGKASFTIKGEAMELLLYRSTQLMRMPGYQDYLFLPFKDATSGKETYGGGKYLDLRIPEDPSTIVIDFNKSYQPYCAYTTGYSCPVPPKENVLLVRIEAGVKQIVLE